MTNAHLIPLTAYRHLSHEEMLAQAQGFYSAMQGRRSVRDFSSTPVPRPVIETCLRAAGTAPSGAHMQPWHFVAISDHETKRRIRQAAEERERAFYQRLAGDDWLEALAPLGTNWRKPFLEEAPWLIAIMAQRSHEGPDGQTVRHYYVNESVGIALGLLVAAIHQAGLASLVYTPTKPSFLNDLLARPRTERPYALLVVGHPAPDAQVPDHGRKGLEEIATFS